MTEFNVGDRVKVEYEGTVEDWTAGSVKVDGEWIAMQYVTRLPDPMPTKIGAVIRADGMLWAFDGKQWNTPNDCLNPEDFGDAEFEVIHEGVDVDD